MFQSKKKLFICVVKYLIEDNDPMSNEKMLVVPCENRESAEAFERHYRNKFSDTQLMQVDIVESSIYNLYLEGVD